MRKREHIADLMFVVVLLLLFASLGLFVVMVGAGVYKNTVNQAQETDSSRTAIAYIEEKIRQNNEVGKIEVSTIEDSQSFLIHSTVNNEEYITYIYCYDGWLWELYTKASNEVKLGMGQSLVKLSNLSIENLGDGLYELEVGKLNVLVHLLEEEL